ncbi:hypothetical protein [Neisseria montereyensis]|nr:hypothetical protein [Neisseria montereyensis]
MKPYPVIGMGRVCADGTHALVGFLKPCAWLSSYTLHLFFNRVWFWFAMEVAMDWDGCRGGLYIRPFVWVRAMFG